jgi:predicted DNA-binding protein
MKLYKRNSFMPKTITLRLSDEDYQKLLSFAQADNRPIANAIETLALRQLEETLFVDPYEMEEIMSDESLLKRMKAGSDQARKMKGRFVE